MPTIWLTRPSGGSSQPIAEAAARVGAKLHYLPLQHYEYQEVTPPDATETLVLSSPRALTALTRQRWQAQRPLVCIGANTAQAALNSGYEVAAQFGQARDFLRAAEPERAYLVLTPQSPAIDWEGEAGQLRLRSRCAYRAVLPAVPPAYILAAVPERLIVLSARVSTWLVCQPVVACWPKATPVLAISPRVAAPWRRAGFSALSWAKYPSPQAIAEAIPGWLAHRPGT